MGLFEQELLNSNTDTFASSNHILASIPPSFSKSSRSHDASPDITEHIEADQFYDLFWDEALALSKSLSTDPTLASNGHPEDEIVVDHGGVTIQGSSSQFSTVDGRSASTAICLYAASRLLRQMDDEPRCFTSDLIDSTIQMGVFLYQYLILQQEHTSVHELWTQQAFRDFLPLLDCADAICGCTSHRDFGRCLKDAAHFASSQGESSVALIIKPPEMILMLFKGTKRGAPWFLFDTSHGKSSDRKKVAYILQLETIDDAATVLFDVSLLSMALKKSRYMPNR